MSDASNERLQMLTKDGTHIGTFGSKGDGPGQFDFPMGAAKIIIVMFEAT